MKNRILLFVKLPLITALIFAFNQPIAAKSFDEEFEAIRYKHRINAHGDEFMSLAKSSDEKRLAIGTEKGELIIWNIVERKIEKRFSQNQPIHAVEFLKDNQHVITGGGNHTGVHNCAVRKWNIDKGTFVEFPCASDSILLLSVDKNSGLVAATDSEKNISVWDGATGKSVASWELKDIVTGLVVIGKKIYFTSYYPGKTSSGDENASADLAILSVDDFEKPAQILIPKSSSPLFYEIMSSPDGKYLSAKGVEDNLQQIFIIDLKSGKVINAAGSPQTGLTLTMGTNSGETVKSESSNESIWTANNEIVLFNDFLPDSKLTFNADGTFTRQKLSDPNAKPGWHRAGMPDNLQGIAASNDGKRYWTIFQIFGTLAEYDPDSHKYNIIYESKSLPFAMDVRLKSEGDGYFATCGDDQFIRVWNLTDLSLKREFKVNLGVPQGVALMTDGKTIVYSASSRQAPTEVFSANIESGETKKILSINEPFVNVKAAGNGFAYNLKKEIILASAADGATKFKIPFSEQISLWAASANGKWLAVGDDKNAVFSIDAATGEKREWKVNKIESPTKIAINNDGSDIYITNFSAALYRLKTNSSEPEKVVEGFRGQASSLRLSFDEKYAIIGGNHRDIGVYDLSNGETLFYNRYIDSSDFYITNSWMRDNRLIFTTDGGVMYDGILEK